MEQKFPMDDLLGHLHNVHPVGDNFKTLLPVRMAPIEGPFTENRIVLRTGEVAKWASWMPIGYARAFVLIPGEFPDEVKQQTIKFWKPGEIVVVMDSFFKQQPSTHFLEFSRGAVLRSISFEQLQLMKLQTTETNELIGKILSDDYTEVFDRAALLKLPCLERYMTFLEYFHPRIEQYFELRAIASYLGMDPTTLAILRNGGRKK